MNDKRRPRFDKYHPGRWPHAWDEGVGMAFSGKPTDPLQLIDILQAYSCSPIAARRILDELDAGRTKYTTVRAHLPFDDIGDMLAEIGVTLKIVPPVDSHSPDVALYDQAALNLLLGRPDALSRFRPDERSLIEANYRQARASMERLPYGLGKFVD